MGTPMMCPEVSKNIIKTNIKSKYFDLFAICFLPQDTLCQNVADRLVGTLIHNLIHT